MSDLQVALAEYLTSGEAVRRIAFSCRDVQLVEFVQHISLSLNNSQHTIHMRRMDSRQDGLTKGIFS